jgi:hypothetical protein
MSARVRLIAAILGVLVASTSAVLIAAPAQAASKSTDLSVTLTNAPDAGPGEKITYTIVVHNNGGHAARQVRIVFKTTAALRQLKHKTSKGYCYRSPKKSITCLFGTIKIYKSASVKLTGVMPTKLKKGDPVTNTVTVTSSTKLIKRDNDKASDNYQIGIPRVPKPVVSASAPNKIQEFNTATQKVFNLSQGAVVATWVVLGAAVLWFIIGLTWRHRSRARRGISYTDDY